MLHLSHKSWQSAIVSHCQPKKLLKAAALVLGAGAIASAETPSVAQTSKHRSEAPLPMPIGAYAITVESDVMVPMRDNVRLATDIYRPVDKSGTLPAILIRTPYNKLRVDAGVEWARFFASHGYIVAVQDVRGKFRSEGVFTVTGSDARDGFDSIGWLAAQPWSNGRVGTFGCSYLGLNQVMTALLRPPALKAMIANAAGGALGNLGGRASYFGARRGGAFELAASMQWFPVAGAKRANQLKPTEVSPKPMIDIQTQAWVLPVADILPRGGVLDTDWADFAARPLHDSWWRSFGYVDDESRADVPTLWINSWYDYGVAETLALREHFARTSLSSTARDNQPVILSPAEHCQSEKLPKGAVVQGRSMGDPRFDYWGTYLKWFDRWLRSPTETTELLPNFQYFVMGRNQWQTASRWPQAGMAATTLYLSSQRGANSRFGDGKLLPTAGTAREDIFVYDPASPVPSVGGPFCCHGFPPSGSQDAYDHRSIETRNDVLVYTSPPLTHDLEIGGPVTLHLDVSSTAADTDFTAKLLVVEPDGRAIALLETIQRARYRNGFKEPVALSPGTTNALHLVLGHTSNVFKRGERLRIEISSSNFPRFDRNLNPRSLNEGEDMTIRTAVNRVHSGASSRTRLEFFASRPPAFARP